MALPIDAIYELFGFLRRTRVDVAQQPIQRERAIPNQVRRIFDGLWRTIHGCDHCSAVDRLMVYQFDFLNIKDRIIVAVASVLREGHGNCCSRRLARPASVGFLTSDQFSSSAENPDLW